MPERYIQVFNQVTKSKSHHIKSLMRAKITSSPYKFWSQGEAELWEEISFLRPQISHLAPKPWWTLLHILLLPEKKIKTVSINKLIGSHIWCPLNCIYSIEGRENYLKTKNGNVSNVLTAETWITRIQIFKNKNRVFRVFKHLKPSRCQASQSIICLGIPESSVFQRFQKL